MNILDSLDAAGLRADLPAFRPGDTLKVYVRVIEGNRSRIQMFQGLTRLVKLEPLVPDAREVGVPTESLNWVETQARAQRDALVEAGYALHGDPDRLLPSGAATQGPDECRALALALSLLAGRS